MEFKKTIKAFSILFLFYFSTVGPLFTHIYNSLIAWSNHRKIYSACIAVLHIATVLTLLFCGFPIGSLQAQLSPEFQAMNQPIQPLHLISNIYYVGASDVTSYLITTPQGHILLDCGFPETVLQIETNVVRLGFRLGDIKILLVTHAHIDHAGGMAALKSKTGAKLFTSEADAMLMKHGGKGDFQWGDRLAFPPVQVDHIVLDEDTVKLGDVKLVAHLTPGHTKGSLTWTMKVQEGSRSYDVVFLGGVSSPGYQLANNSKYPNIVADYLQTFALLKRLPCDVFLGGHASFFALKEKKQRLESGITSNPFILPEEYKIFLARAEKDFLENCREQGTPADSSYGK
jgi:metallo-beta-lactamase class B